MPSGPGALLGAEVWMAVAITCAVTVGQSSVGPGEIGGAGGASGGWGNIGFRKVLHLDRKSTACCPWKFRIGVLSTRRGLVYLYAVKTSFPLADNSNVLQSACLACRIAWKYAFLDC